MNEKWLSVMYNQHHPTTGNIGYFDLGKLLQDNAKSDWDGASKYATDLAEAIEIAERN
jgi:hypothetical protein